MISFVYPLWLVILPIGLVGLFMLFRRGGTIEAKKISSLFLLKNLEQEIQQKKKKDFPLRFLVELLTLLLLVASVASLVIPHFTKQYILVVDNSPSMDARMPSGETTLEAAKSAASYFIQSQPLGSLFSIWITSPEQQALQPEFESGATSKARVEQIRIGYSDDNLPKLISRVAESNTTAKTIVFSDYSKPEMPGQMSANNVVEQITIMPQGFERPNFAIQEATKLSDNALSVTIFANDQARRQHSDLTLTIAVYESGQWQNVASEAVEIGGNRLSLPAKAGRAPLKVTLAAESDSSAADNTFYLSDTKDPSQTIVVSDKSERELGLSQINSLKLVRMSTQEFTEKRSSLTNAIFVFDAAVPEKSIGDVSGKNSALILLPTSGSIAVKQANNDGVRLDTVASFDTGNPLVRYINPALLMQSSGISLVSKKPSIQEIIQANDGNPLLVSYEEQGLRTVVSGFKLLPYEGKRSPVESLLLLNCLRWLGVHRQGPLSNSETVIDSSVGIKDSEIVNQFRIPALFLDKKPTENSGATSGIFARNFFSGQESNLASNTLPTNNTQNSSGETRALSPSQALQGFDAYLWGLLALVIGLDIILLNYWRRYGATSH